MYYKRIISYNIINQNKGIIMAFGFLKSKNTQNQNTDTSQLIYQLINDVELECDNQRIKLINVITNLQKQGDKLTIDINLDNKKQAEQLYQQLHERLTPYGIHEIDMNVQLNPPTNPQKSSETLTKTLPKTINANKNSTSHTKQSQKNSSAPKQSDLQAHPRIRHILAVASGKGGVGKSTTTVNLALALQKLGHQVGVLDADIYGPSIPTMLGIERVKPDIENEQFIPINAHGLAALSIGSLLDTDSTPIAWRGPKATGALMQLFHQTNWPNLDYLLIDLPPGTGDIQLTLAQRIPITAAIIVTTPQHVALMDAQKGIEFFKKTDIAVLGLIENMALHTCSQCGHTEAIFGQGGGNQLANLYGMPLLGQLPLASGIREQTDQGIPSVIANHGTGDDFATFYINIAQTIDTNIAPYAKKATARIF